MEYDFMSNLNKMRLSNMQAINNINQKLLEHNNKMPDYNDSNVIKAWHKERLEILRSRDSLVDNAITIYEAGENAKEHNPRILN